MNYVCAWCKKPLPGKTSEGERTSHGICPSCVDAHFPEVAEEFKATREAA